ncbi:DNA-methyltransferase [Bremerella cremea]|uniref:DNA-methyltransferase n=1 Tax=Bremerella cremea TaxID=1031537 RepID=UPI0031E8481A
MKCIYDADGQTLYQGDCLAVLAELKRQDQQFDALISDPPYSSGGLHASSRKATTSSKYQSSDAKKKFPDFLGDNMDQRSYRAWAMLWLGAAIELLKPGGIVCLFTDWRQLPTMTDVLQGAGVLWHGVASWDKVNARPRLGGISQRCEFVVWGSKGKLERKGPSLPGALRHNLVPSARRVHCAEKPVELMTDLLKLIAWREDAAVLDPFAGSGTTLVAARELGLRAVGIEKSPEIAAIACERLCGEQVTDTRHCPLNIPQQSLHGSELDEG